MSFAFENIDLGLFLSDFETFKEKLLPIINRDMEKEGKPIYEGEEAMDLYLDLLYEHRKDAKK